MFIRQKKIYCCIVYYTIIEEFELEMSHLVERYANLLSKDDVLELFQTLQQVYKGNVSKACRKCGIQRKTSYGIRKRGIS